MEGTECEDCKDMAMYYIGELKDEDEDTIQSLERDRHPSGICPECASIGRLNDICIMCAEGGIGRRHLIQLESIPEEQHEVHVIEEQDEAHALEEQGKPTASEWLVDSGALVHVTNNRNNLNEPEATMQAVTIGSGKVMVAQFKGRRATVLADMSGNTVELENTLYIPNFKKKIVSLSKLLDQGYKVEEWTKTHLKISKNQKSIIIKRKQAQQMYYLIGFKVQPAVYATDSAMDINKAHEKLGHVGEENDAVLRHKANGKTQTM